MDAVAERNLCMTRRWHGLLALIMLVLVIVAYWPAFSAGYIWDDDDYVTENPALKSAEGLDGLRYIWIPRHTPQYYPVVFTSFWIEEQIYPEDPTSPGGKSAAGYHVVNVAFHAANSLLIIVLLRVLGIRDLLAWAIAFLFALHPVHVESVAWITERKNVLSMFFYLLAALSYLRFDQQRENRIKIVDEKNVESKADTPWAWYGASIILFVLALLSKSVTASLPVAIVLMLLYQREQLSVRRLWPLLFMLILGAVAGLHTGWLEKYHVGAMGADWELAIDDRIYIASRAALFYPWKILCPWSLMFVYPRWDVAGGNLFAHWPVVVIALILLVAAVYYKKGHRVSLLALLFYGVSIFPALGFANIYPMRFSFVADHFQYLASLGIIVLVVAAMRALLRHTKMFVLVHVLVCCVLCVLSHRQTYAYENETVFYQQMIADNPDAWLGHSNLSRIYLERAQRAMREEEEDESQQYARLAEDAAKQAANIKSANDKAWSNLSEALRLQNRYTEARAALERAIEAIETERQFGIEHDLPRKHDIATGHKAGYLALMGRLYELENNDQQAIEHYNKSLELKNNLPQPLRRLAELAIKQDNNVLAAEYIQRLVDSGFRVRFELYLLAADVMQESGEYHSAEQMLGFAAQQITSAKQEHLVLYRLIWLRSTANDALARNGRWAVGAAEQFVQATGRSSPHAYLALAVAQAEVGQFDLAIRAAELAQQLADEYQLSEMKEQIEKYSSAFKSKRPWRE